MSVLRERMLDRLASAMAEPVFEDRRAGIRKLAHEVMEKVTSNAQVAAVLKASPLVGASPTQINPRPSIAGLRDSLTLETMICLVHAWAAKGDEGARSEALAIFNAVKEPSSFGITAAGTRTGYAFGRTRQQDDARLARIIRGMSERLTARTPATSATTTTETEETHMLDETTIETTRIEDLDHSELLVAVDQAALNAGVSVEAMLALLGSTVASDEANERVAALRAAVKSRSTATAEPRADASLSAPARRLMEAMMAAAAGGSVVRPSTPPLSAPVKLPGTGLTGSLEVPTGPQAALIDLALTSTGLPQIGILLGELTDTRLRASEAEKAMEVLKEKLKAATTAIASAVGSVELHPVRDARHGDLQGFRGAPVRGQGGDLDRR